MQAAGDAFGQKIVPHPPGAVGSIAADEARPNLGAKLLIAAAASAARPLQPSIEPTPRVVAAAKPSYVYYEELPERPYCLNVRSCSPLFGLFRNQDQAEIRPGYPGAELRA